MRSVSIARYPVAAMLSHIRAAMEGRGPPMVEIDGEPVGVRSLRLRTFLVRGVACASCGITGTHFRKERSSPTDPRAHLNLYAEVAGSVEVLMTKDHVRPRSRGGPDLIENMQTMCLPCNNRKGASCHS